MISDPKTKFLIFFGKIESIIFYICLIDVLIDADHLPKNDILSPN